MKWFTARALADNPRAAHIVIDKPIGSDWAPDWISDFTGEKPARDFIDEIESLGELDEINLELNSPGGDVASGIRIFNYLRNHQATVHIRVTGTAASIATVILMAGDTRTMGVGATIMTHRAASLMIGFYTAAEMKEFAKNIDVIDAAIVDAYVAATGKTADEISALLDQGDTFMGADEAINWGFATDKDAKLQAVASADPKLFMKQLQQEGKIRELQAKLGGGNRPMTAADALALAFDITPEEAEAQAADLGDQIIAMRQQAPGDGGQQARAVAEPIAQALGMETDAVLEDPKAAADRLKAKVDEAGELAVDQDRTRITAIIKACQTTGQSQLLEKLVENGMPEAQASDYIYDVAAASGNRHSIHNSHSPEGGHRAGIDYQKIYDRQNQRA